MMAEIVTSIITMILSSGIAATIVSIISIKRTKQIEENIREASEKNIEEFKSTREKKEEMLSELIGPVVMHLHRTSRAFNRYKEKNEFLEAEVLYKGNLAIRDILLDKGYLLDKKMIKHAIDLIEHYDAWMEEFERHKFDVVEFVFAGPRGYPFPRNAEKAFINACESLKSELYGDQLEESV
jgi:Zn-dependent M32 family carboxypeptidase